MPDAHALWSAAQLAPGEGIEDGVARIETLLARPAPAGEPEMPTLPQALLNTIGEYGMARTDRVSQLEVTHRWQLLISGIKDYARAYGDARAEHACRVAPGYVLMPEEMTEAMEDAAHEAAYIWRLTEWRAAERARYAAIRAAAPPQGEPK